MKMEQAVMIVSMAQELTAAQQRIAELELDNGALTALHADLGAQLTAAWQATGVAGMVRGLTTLADVVGVHRAEMDTLRARIAVLEACIAAARAALTPDLVADGLRRMLGETNDRAALSAVEVDKREAECRAAQQRIAELEQAHVKAKDEHTGDAIVWFEKEHDLTTILRAIYPVYRAAVASRDERDQWSALSRAVTKHIHSAVDAARAALTPELIAAIKAAGVEVE